MCWHGGNKQIVAVCRPPNKQEMLHERYVDRCKNKNRNWLDVFDRWSNPLPFITVYYLLLPVRKSLLPFITFYYRPNPTQNDLLPFITVYYRSNPTKMIYYRLLPFITVVTVYYRLLPFITFHYLHPFCLLSERRGHSSQTFLKLTRPGSRCSSVTLSSCKCFNSMVHVFVPAEGYGRESVMPLSGSMVIH
jgi:hypothetical protein